MDHYLQLETTGDADRPMLEGYTTLGFLAAANATAELQLLCTGVTYRHPGLLAKMIATLDVLSGGRATLGIGAAWYEREHRALGVPFPPLAERFERLEEVLQICRQMWDPDEVGPYEGRHYRLAETLCSRLPLSTPRPEILVGGSGERKTLRLVAQYADACNLFTSDPDELRHKLDVLRGHCDDVGRDVAEIRVTILHNGDALQRGDVAAFVDEMRGLAAIGVETVILRPPPTSLAAWVRDVVAPAVEPLGDLA